MTQRRLLVAQAGEPADAESFGAGSVGDILIRKSPAIPGAPDDYGWGTVLGRSAATSADLSSAAFADMPIGIGVYVTSRGRIYWAVPLGRGDIAGTGNDWKSDPSTSDPALRLQASWRIDAEVGDNDNDGSPASPIADGDEFVARMGGPEFLLSILMTIAITGDVEIPRLICKPIATTTNAGLLIVGTPTAMLLASTVTYFAGAGNSPPKITAAGVADWAVAGPGNTSLICDAATRNVRGTFTTGAAAGAHFWGAKKAPDAGDGSDVLRIHDLAASPIGLLGVTTVVPANGDAFEFHALPKVGVIDIDFRGQVNGDVTNTVYTPSLRIENLWIRYYVDSMVSCPIFAPGTNILFGCAVQNFTASLGRAQQAGALTVVGCWLNVTSLENALIGWGLITGVGKSLVPPSIFIAPGATLETGHNTWQGTRANILGNWYVSAGVDYICDAVGAAVTCVGTILVTAGGLRGYGSSQYGLVIKNGARFQYASTLPSITGTLGDIQVTNNGGTALVLSWGTMPWNDGVYSGTATLGVGGTVNVAIPYLAAGQKVTYNRNTPSGAGTLGNLSAPTAARTTTQFTLNSDNAADRSSIDWQTSAYGTGINISRWL